MELAAYCARIGYGAEVRADVATLFALHRAHVCSIPFENLDVQLGRPLSIDVDAAHDKIVRRRRGGWCYEQNGLFGLALDAAGFDVQRIGAGVMQHERGEVADSNHLCLIVTIPGDELRYLVDVGFGGSLIAPLVLLEGVYEQPPFEVGLRRLDDERWRFFEDRGDGRFSYDFRDLPASEARLAARGEFLQTSPGSGFVQNLVAQRRTTDSHVRLRGRVLNRLGPMGEEETLLNSADELVDTLRGFFGLDVPETAQLWQGIVARHQDILAARTD